MNHLYHFDFNKKVSKDIGDELVCLYSLTKRLQDLLFYLENNYKNSKTLVDQLRNQEFGSDFKVEKVFDFLNSQNLQPSSIEIVFEYIRQTEFKNKPSRFRCTFLTKDISAWNEVFKVNEKTNPYIIYKFEIAETSRIFESDGYIVTKAANKEFHEVEDLARVYWENNFKYHINNEFLFCGSLKVINKAVFN